MSEEPKSLIKIPDSVDNAIKNTTDKPTKNIGNTIGDLWYIVFGGISYQAEKKKIKYNYLLDQYREELTKSISNIPPEKRTEPSIQVTAQALDNSKYCIEEDELREMFVSLISNSMNSDYSELIHPSYSEIIKQMSILDAKIIRLFKDNVAYPVCQYCLNLSEKAFHHTTMPDHIFLDFPDADVISCSQSLSSLLRFGIITISYESKVNKPNAYDKFLQHPFYEEMKNILSVKITLKEGCVMLSPLGRSFVSVCIPD